MTAVTIGSASHPGLRKSVNEDYFDYFPPSEGNAHKKGILLALADGMGGRRGGALAAKTAVDILMEEYYKEDVHSIPEALERAFQKSNQAVMARGRSDPELEGMATTLTAVVIKDDRMYYAHVGDSRGYIIDQDDISHFTAEHSYVADLVKAGAITEEQALTHPQANLITRAIGLKAELKIDLCRDYQRLHTDQYILICCDGLYKVVPDGEILQTIHEHPDPNAACEHLVAKANAHGGPDNITILMAKIERVKAVSGFINRFLSAMR